MFFGQMGIAGAAAFCRRMGIGLRAGVDLLRLLDAESRHGSSRQQQMIAEVLEAVKQGEPISEAMAARSVFFPRLMVALTRVGESTGKLEQTFLTLADHYDQQVSLRRRFLKSIAWPLIQLPIGLGVISWMIYLMGVLTPVGGGEMADMLGFGLRGSSGVLIFWAYIACVAAILWSLYYGFRKNLGGVQNLLPLFYLVPKLGPAVQTITLSRFTRTLALSLGAGLDPIRSVKLSLNSTDSDYYSGGGKIFETAVRDRGETLAEGLRATDLFPEDFLHLVDVAELSGTESESIEHLAGQYEERAKMAVTTLSGIATGVIWLAVAGVMIYLILRLAMNVFGAYDLASQPI
jgi:type II secretory pathway component PulF